MKRLFYILTSLLVLSSCTDELSVSNEYRDVREGDDVKVQFSINAPEEGIAETRTLGEMTDDDQKALNVWLLVFDENGLFVQAAQATPGGNVTDGSHKDTKFTATLNATSATRIIHFVAFDADGATGGLSTQISNTINKFGTDVEKIARELYATAGQAAYWQRVVVNKIKEGPLATNGCVPLVRNFAKVTVALKDGISNFTLDGFTIINVPDKGTIAPYKGGFVEYVSGKTQKTYEAISALGYEGSTPSGTTYSTPEITEDNESEIINKDPHYLYETPNASGDLKGNTALIVKGSYNNGEPSFYKVDLIYDPIDDKTGKIDETAGHMFYNILRNFEYKVTINEVTGNGHASFDEAAASAASNNLSSSTVTANLSRISDGEQMLEVTNTYFMFTKAGAQQVLKYRYRYSSNGGTTWITNNDLVKLTNSNNDLFDGETGRPQIDYTSADRDDDEGWRTITMELAAPATQAKTSNLHIYASRSAIDALTEQDIDPDLKASILSGELLYRDVRVDLRTPYALLVAPQSYVAATAETKFRVDLLIPQGVNEALFPMDFYVEDSKKYIYPDASVNIKLPVHVGQSIVTGVDEASFQYARTVTKAEYASLGTRTVGNQIYKVIPCYFKTNIAASDVTTVYADNEYFNVGSGKFSNIPAAFQDNTVLTIAGGTKEYAGQTYQTTELFGKKNPVTLTFYTTQEAVNANTQFNISITEGGETTTGTATLSTANPVSYTDGNGVTYTYYKQEYAYETQTTNGASIAATITAQYSGGDNEVKNASLTMQRRYFVIAKNSFTTDIASHLTAPNTTDGSQIYVTDGYNPDFNGGTYVGWFGRGLSQASDGYLGNDGPHADYVIDRFYQGYTTLTDDDIVTFRIYNTNIKATTTIGVLDDARNGTTTEILFSNQ